MTATTATATKTVTREQETLIRDNMALVGHMVREMLFKVPAHVHRDDLASAGYAALVTAARGFDPARGIPFGRFAAMRVRGALLDELRGMDWASRSVRARARRADVARQELTAKLGRTPTPTELAELLGVGVSELATVDDDVQRAAVLSLQGFTAGAAEDMVTEHLAEPRGDAAAPRADRLPARRGGGAAGAAAVRRRGVVPAGAAAVRGRRRTGRDRVAGVAAARRGPGPAQGRPEHAHGAAGERRRQGRRLRGPPPGGVRGADRRPQHDGLAGWP